MARGIRSRFIVCGAIAALLLTPAFATEESAKAADKPKEEKKADAASDKADAKKPAEAAKADDAECKPTATRVNTLEDLFGISNWGLMQARTVKPAVPTTEIAWRDATAESKPAAAEKPAKK